MFVEPVNNNNITHQPVVVVYTGQEITTIPRNVTHLVVASNVTTIEAFAFCQCHNLVSVEFHYGLEVIAEFAFGYCTSLEKIRLPSSMRVIGRNVFTRCTRLQSVELNEGLVMLRDGVFSFCLALKRLRIPSTVVEIERELLFSCSALETLEMPPNNTIRSIESHALCGCTALKSLKLPPSSSTSRGKQQQTDDATNDTTTFGDGIFVDCPELEVFVLRGLRQETAGNIESSDLLVAAFQLRFYDILPIHELCYHHTYRPIFETIEKIQSLFPKGENSDECQRDLFDMTPFHILALSSKPNYHLLTTLQRLYPLSAQLEKDIYGKTPIEYVMENRTGSLQDECGLFQCLIQSTVLDRLENLPLHQRKQVHREFVEQVEQLYQQNHATQRTTIIRNIYTKLSRMERHESLSLTELSIWKAKIKAVSQNFSLDLLMNTTRDIHLSGGNENNDGTLEEGLCTGVGNRNKRARICRQDPILDRQACKVNCGADIILRNVIPFLPPLFANDD